MRIIRTCGRNREVGFWITRIRVKYGQRGHRVLLCVIDTVPVAVIGEGLGEVVHAIAIKIHGDSNEELLTQTIGLNQQLHIYGRNKSWGHCHLHRVTLNPGHNAHGRKPISVADRGGHSTALRIDEILGDREHTGTTLLIHGHRPIQILTGPQLRGFNHIRDQHFHRLDSLTPSTIRHYHGQLITAHEVGIGGMFKVKILPGTHPARAAHLKEGCIATHQTIRHWIGVGVRSTGCKSNDAIFRKHDRNCSIDHLCRQRSIGVGFVRHPDYDRGCPVRLDDCPPQLHQECCLHLSTLQIGGGDLDFRRRYHRRQTSDPELIVEGAGAQTSPDKIHCVRQSSQVIRIPIRKKPSQAQCHALVLSQ